MTRIANFLNPQAFGGAGGGAGRVGGREKSVNKLQKEYWETWIERKVCEPFRLPLKAGGMPARGQALFFTQ